MSQPNEEPTVALTPKAVEKVEGFRAAVPDADEQAMWIEVTGVAGGEFTYDISLKPLSAVTPGDRTQLVDGLAVVVRAGDVDKLRGATIDWSDDLMRGGLFVSNPNPARPTIATAEGELTGPLAERVAQVIESQINPAIAAHGGSAELVAVEEGAAYLRLGGGCVGCGMASVTLTQGIEVAITTAVPEVTRVVDVTDHASGTNPYYEASKK